jgi:tetratricopeptide (TPR) repeat protein
MSPATGRSRALLPTVYSDSKGARGERFPVLRLTLLVFAAAVALAFPQEELNRLYSEAQEAQARGDLATASQKYEGIVRLRPQMAEAYANLGNLYYQQGQPERAKPAYAKALQIKPDLAGPHFFLGVIAFGEHDYSAALRHLERAKTLERSNALVPAYLGYVHYARSEYGEATVELERAAEIEPRNIDVLYHLSKCYGHLAKESFGLLQQRFPDSVYTNLARGHFYETDQNWTAASEQYNLALQKMPGSARLAQRAKWAAAKAAGDPGSAPGGTSDQIADASLAYKDASLAGAEVRSQLAAWRASVQQTKQGRDDREIYLSAEGYQVLSYLSALAVFDSDPNSYRAHQLRAQLLESSNKDDEAIAEYRKALELKPELQNVHFAIGALYWKDQRFDEARAELKKELELNPNHPHALYELGDICASTGDPQGAEKYLLSAVKLEPTMAEAHFALEKIYTQSGRYQESLNHLRKAMAIDASDATAHYRLAAVYRKLGRNAEAEKELSIFNQKQAASRTSPQSGSSTVK